MPTQLEVSIRNGFLNTHNMLWNVVTLEWENATVAAAGGANVNVLNFPATYPVTDNGGSLTVDALALPLPAGAATSAIQATQQTSLNNLDIPISDSLDQYKISDKDEDASPNYYGFLDKAGNWFILQETVVAGADTYRYFRGAPGGYAAAWVGRAALVYDYFNVIF